MIASLKTRVLQNGLKVNVTKHFTLLGRRMTIDCYLGIFLISVFIYSGCGDPSSDSKIEDIITDECSNIGNDK